jgi:hypothetical protein
VAAEGGEGEAADVAVSRLLERRRLLMALKNNPNETCLSTESTYIDQVFKQPTYLIEKWFKASAMKIDKFKHKHTTIPPVK